MEKLWWHNFDLLSNKSQLFTQGRVRYSSYFGFVMTIASLLLVFSFSLYLIFNFFQRKEMNIIYSSEVSDEKSIVDMNNKTVLIRLIDKNGNPIDPRIFNIKSSFQKKNNQTDINYHSNSTFYHNLNPYTCFNLDNVTEIKIEISECRNNTDLNIFCIPENHIKEFLLNNELFIDYILPSNSINHFNRTNPLEDTNNKFTRRIDYTFHNYFSEQFSFINYRTDEGLIFENQNNILGYQRDLSESYHSILRKNNESLTFFTLEINLSSNKLETISRIYPKIYNLVAIVVGFIKLTLCMTKVITEWISHQMMIVDLSNLIVRYETEHNHKNDQSSVIEFKREFDISPVINKIDIIQQKRRKENQNLNIKNSFSLTCIEAVIPACFSCKNSSKRVINNLAKIIRTKLSSDYLLKTIEDFEKLKRTILDNKQIVIFDIYKNPTINEHLHKLMTFNRMYDSSEVEDCFDELRRREDIISKSLIKGISTQKG